MRRTWTFSAELLLAIVLCLAGSWLWLAHARARDLGGSVDVLGYDAAQYAVAARELAEHGRLATPFALPVELARHSDPPWPLALVQPGLLVVEAAVFRLAGRVTPERLGWTVLLLPFSCYLAAAWVLARGTAALLAQRTGAVSPLEHWLAGLVVGMAFLLDPEALHHATGGFTEMPFTLGLAIAVVWLAVSEAPSPIGFGLLLGSTGLFRGNMLWLAPALALALALALPGRRASTFARCLATCAAMLAPWWIYKWRAFGAPGWDLSVLSLWDGVGGRTWFSLNHLPEMPQVPSGFEAIGTLCAKAARNLPGLVLQAASGPRTLWIAGLVVYLLARRAETPEQPPVAGEPPPPSPGRRDGARASAAAALALVVLSLVASALTVPQLRYLLPARLVAEAAGLVSVWAYLSTLPDAWASARARRWMCVGIAALALGWGAWRANRGLDEAARTARERGIPSSVVLRRLAGALDRDLAPGEAVMSNLGPTLAWYARRPVLHLALTPGDVPACRRRLEFQNVVVAFREPSRAWRGWDELMTNPREAPHHPEWTVRQVRTWTEEGFQLVWLELEPTGPPMAAR